MTDVGGSIRMWDDQNKMIETARLIDEGINSLASKILSIATAEQLVGLLTAYKLDIIKDEPTESMRERIKGKINKIGGNLK